MGTNQSKTKRGANKRNKENHNTRNKTKQNQPISTAAEVTDPIRSSLEDEPIRKAHAENGPMERENHRRRERKENSQPISGESTTNNSNDQKKENSRKKRKKRVTMDKEAPGNGDLARQKRPLDGSSELENAPIQPRMEERRTRSKKKIHQIQKEQVENDRRMQRVTKEQMRSLASTLQRTAWYLGRRLGMKNDYVERMNRNFATEQERKYQILLWWRRVRGWKATVQQLVILLELAGYDYEEYKMIVTSSNNGDVIIYDKPPKLPPVVRPEEVTHEFYQDDKYDVTKHHGRSYGNMNYDDILTAEEIEKLREKSKHHHIRTKERHRSEQPRDHRQYHTLPPRWKKPENRQKKEEDKEKEAVYENVEEIKTDEFDQAPPSSVTTSGKQRVKQECSHSNESHTDDSGFMTSSCTTSPKLLTARPSTNQSTTEVQMRNQTDGREAEHSYDDHSNHEVTIPPSNKGGAKNKPSTLIVRRCSDSSVKLTYATSLRDKMAAAKIAESPIQEYESADELGQIFSKNNKEDDNHDSIDDLTKRDNDVIDETYKKDIRFMIAKYETLTKLKAKAKNRDSINSLENLKKRNYASLPRNFTEASTKNSKFSSNGSLQSIRLHDVINRRYTSHYDTTKTDKIKEYKPKYREFKFGGKGKFPSRFKGLISGLAVFPNGDIVTSDSGNKRIQIFDNSGKFLTAFDTNTELKPKGLCITPSGQIAVCCGSEVLVFDRDGRRHLSFGQGVFRNNCYCICCDINGNYYVTDIVSHTISVHDRRGRIRKRFGFQGSGMINFNQPVSLAINSQNHLFISDSQNHCVKVYTLAGRPLYRIGAKGSSDGLFWNPLGLCIDSTDELYVADCGNNRISEFDSRGNFIRHILTEDDQLWMPSLVQMTNRGQLIVCEWEKQQVKVFSIETEV